VDEIPPALPDEPSWSDVADHVLHLEGFTDFEREKLRRSIRRLDDSLGPQTTSIRTLYSLVHNYAPWTRFHLAHLSDDLHDAAGMGNFQQLQQRLREEARFAEARSVLGVAARLGRTGFDVSFDTPVRVHGNQKIPDIAAIWRRTGDRIVVEVSSLGPSREEEETWRSFRAVTDLFWMDRDLAAAGRLKRTLSGAHLEVVLGEIRRLMERVRQTKQAEEFVRNDVLDLAVAPREDEVFLKLWKAQHGLTGTFEGPASSGDALNRVMGKIRNEQKQLPHDEPSSIVLHVPLGTFGYMLSGVELARIAARLEETVFEFPHLFSVVLLSESLSIGKTEIVQQHGGQVHFMRLPRKYVEESGLLLTNRLCELKMALASITAWNRAFLG
jgi:hypothetical protein